MPLEPLQLRPTQAGGATPSTARGVWWDMSLTRFLGGVLTPVGGWSAIEGLATAGACRRLLSWRDNLHNACVAAASYGQVLAQNATGVGDITPSGWVAGEPADASDGYGMGLYGAGDYGTPRDASDALPTGTMGDTVALDTYGENLVVCGSADGRILMWSPGADGLAKPLAPIPNAPSARYVVVTEERSIVAIGADGDPRKVRWCSLENPEDWDEASVTGTAGELMLKTPTGGLSGCRVREGVLVFCHNDVHLLRYVGAPFVYGLDRVGDGCGPIGPHAFVAQGGRCYWMGKEGFWKWDGGAVVPVPCEMQNNVFQYLNRSTAGRTHAAYNGIFPEAWWWYPTESVLDPDVYVALDVQSEKTWISGVLPRTAAAAAGATGFPLAATAEGQVFNHEWHWTADGAPRGANVYAETGVLQIGKGDRGMLVRQMLFDVVRPDAIELQFWGQWAGNDIEEDLGVWTLDRADGVLDLLVEARFLRMRIVGVLDAPWQLGVPMLDTVPGSGR